MQVKVKAFPVVYFNARCTVHQCNVELNIQGSRQVRNNLLVGGSIYALRCEQGASICSENWELFVNAGGDVIVTQ